MQRWIPSGPYTVSHFLPAHHLTRATFLRDQREIQGTSVRLMCESSATFPFRNRFEFQEEGCGFDPQRVHH